jgi:alanine racemase
MMKDHLRTWVEIDARATRRNYDSFRKMLGKKTMLWSVVKSNAYGHGLFAFTKLADRFGVDGFCVDSIVEGIALRRLGIKKPILVLGPTLPDRFKEAKKLNIAITISNLQALKALAREHRPPEFHLKIDTGMHRQGFYLEELPATVALIKRSTSGIKTSLKGIYTHFAAAKDLRDTKYTDIQLKRFHQAAALFEKAGFKKLIKHVSATGGTLLGARYHLDAVRVGIGLHGVWPSPELARQLSKKIKLTPTLSWKAVVSEVKKLRKGDAIGYDLTERVPRDMMMAVIPIGYWHGFPRALSGVGEVLIHGKKCKVLGRVSMDILVTEAPKGAKPGDVATLIGRDGNVVITADDVAKKAHTTAYEILTRLNPLMERTIV